MINDLRTKKLYLKTCSTEGCKNRVRTRDAMEYALCPDCIKKQGKKRPKMLYLKPYLKVKLS